MIKKIKIRLASPSMIGGINPGNNDNPTVIRIPSLRGILRFWTRAIGGTNYVDVEKKLWGNIDSGQGVRIIPINQVLHEVQHRLFPEHVTRGLNPCPVNMIQLDQEVIVGFSFDDESILPLLQSVVWTWLHIGTIGRRSRRGYGSFLWIPTRNDLLLTNNMFSGITINDLNIPTNLIQYLKNGLQIVERIMGHPSSTSFRRTNNWFKIQTIDQIFVGRHLTAQYNSNIGGMEDLLHGFNNNPGGARGNCNDELGYARGYSRLASPMLWRVFPVNRDLTGGSGYIPVMVWSPLRVTHVQTTITQLYNYFHNVLGFDNSLLGPGHSLYI